MLERESWLPRIEQVPEGHSRRFDHDCGRGKTLQISREGSRYRAWCHRCGEGGSHETVPTMAELAERAARLRAGDASVRGIVPGDVPLPRVLDVRDWPAPAKLWLYKAGLGASEIARLGAWYHPPSNRVVLPVLDGSRTVYWQARSVDGRAPKYMGSPTGRRECVPTYGTGACIAVTEDILSAFKIGLVGEAVSALGTSPSPALVRHLLESGKPVIVALDPDTAGQKGAAKLCKALRAYGIKVTNLILPKDPKLLPRDYLRDALTEASERIAAASNGVAQLTATGMGR